MDVLSSVPAFLIAVVLIWAAPGPAMLLVVRRAAVRGPRAALATVAGLQLALYAWALLAAAGLAAVVAASQVAYDVLRLAGAVVLVALGAQTLRQVWRERGLAEVEAPGLPPGGRRSAWGAFAEGALVQFANPKIAVFMLAFYPQFLPAGQPVLAATAALALLQVLVLVEIGLYLVLLAGVGRLAAAPGDPPPARNCQWHGPRRSGRASGHVLPLTAGNRNEGSLASRSSCGTRRYARACGC